MPVRAAADPPMNWGNPSSWTGFWNHVTREQYGAIGPTKTAEPRSIPRIGRQLRYLGESIADDLTLLLTTAALVGLVAMWRQQRWLLLFVFLWVACARGLFVVLSNFDLDRVSRWAMRVFLIPVSLGLAVPLGFCLDLVVVAVRRAARAPGLLAAGMIALVPIGAVAIQLGTHWRQCDYSKYWYARDHARNLAACMLPNALVFPSGDHNSFPLIYSTMILGERTDILVADIYGYVTPKLIRKMPSDSPDSPEAWMIKRARRPVYYSTKRSPPVDNARFVQAGILYHLLPDAMPFDGEGLLDRCGYRNLQTSTVLDLGASHIMAEYEFFRGLEAFESGAPDAALQHFERAASFGWGIKEVYNNIGSALGEHGYDNKAVEYFEQAVSLDPRYALARWNLYRSHAARRDWLSATAQLHRIMEMAPQDCRAHAEMGILLSERLNEPEQAVRFFREDLQCDPDQSHIRERLYHLELEASDR